MNVTTDITYFWNLVTDFKLGRIAWQSEIMTETTVEKVLHL